MKKFIVLSSVLLLILAFVVTVYGQDKMDFRASGFIDAQTLYWKNVGGGFPAAQIYNSYQATFGPATTVGGLNGDGFNRHAHYMETG